MTPQAKEIEMPRLSTLVGGDILGLVTAGMHANPLVVFREYIQNAADAVTANSCGANGIVGVEIDPSARRVKIRDNGPGLSRDEAVRALVPLARSKKVPGADRGFRGIGRLSGLAFAETVTFLTRETGDRPVTRVAWNGPKLRKLAKETPRLEQLIAESVSVDAIPGTDYPSHFFEVELSGVRRHVAGLLLNRAAVQNYIGEVCPVPISSQFPFVTRVEALLAEVAPPLELTVLLDDNPTPVTRPYGEYIRFSEELDDCFTEFEEVLVPSVDGDSCAAIGWIAHSSYLGAIPKEAGVRGIKARVGNIQVGDEAVFSHLFSEERFNRWCVGEVHVVDPAVLPNGRRDYFESGPHLRNLENRLGAVFRGIVTRCRKASSARNRKRNFLAALSQVEDTYDLARSGYLLPKDAKKLIEDGLDRIRSVREVMDHMSILGAIDMEKLAGLEKKLYNFRAREKSLAFRGLSASEVAIYRNLFQTLTAVSQSPRAAKELIEAILTRKL